MRPSAPDRIDKLEPMVDDLFVLRDLWHIAEDRVRRGDVRLLRDLLYLLCASKRRIDLILLGDLVDGRIRKRRGRPGSRRRKGLNQRAVAESNARSGDLVGLIAYLRRLDEKDRRVNMGYEYVIVPDYGFVADCLANDLGRSRGRPKRSRLYHEVRALRLRASVEEELHARRISLSHAIRRISELAGVSEATVRRAVNLTRK
jgi:hypothetical protein